MSRETGRWFGKQCYFGAHNDFHYMDNDMNAASQATPENFLNYLKILRPDWMQVDSKGHSGNSSYFSRVPAASIAPHLKHDAVAAWRQATREFGIPLVCHYSGFIDLAAARRHPEWMAVLPPGMKRAEPLVWYEATMCPRSNYFDQLMIPQLIELAADWHVDGFWIDGDWDIVAVIARNVLPLFRLMPASRWFQSIRGIPVLTSGASSRQKAGVR